MKVAGIIAEYNPFHNGHQAQIDWLKKEQGYDYVAILMSGDFVQRGAPAIVGKYERARMALAGGADLVLELPSLFSGASAEYFASCGVSLFGALHCVDALCFGCENPDAALLTALADFLTDPPEGYLEHFYALRRSGYSYPTARAAAVRETFRTPKYSGEDAEAFLAGPNNILALEYVKVIRKRRLALTPLPIKRKGGAYHEDAAASEDADIGDLPSAESVRRLLFSGDEFREFVPEEAYEILANAAARSLLLEPDDFSTLLRFRLLETTNYSDYADCYPRLAQTIRREWAGTKTFGELAAALKAKNVTYTRVSRVLINILLGHLQEELDYFSELPPEKALYAKMLGFRKSAEPLLTELKKASKLPLISKNADFREILADRPDAARLFQMDVRASEVYNLIRAEKSNELFPNDFSRPMEILE